MLDYRHFLNLTDENGILQFSKLDSPDPLSGYTLDDNARALIIALNMEEGYDLAYKYASWLFKARRADKSWSNFELDGKFYASFDSEDSVGRALLACSLGINSPFTDIKKMCEKMLKDALPSSIHFRSPRAIAYTLLGLCKIDNEKISAQYSSIRDKLADYLISLYQANHTRKFLWFENYLTYCNGILPQALWAYYGIKEHKKALKIAHDSLSFLNSMLFKKSYLNIIGNRGWYFQGKKPALYDQQPVDAASTAFACFEAYSLSGGSEYLELAILAHRWFRGYNINQLSLYNPKTGGCYDALTPEGVNLNQGAEAVISLLLTDTLMLSFIKQQADMEKTS
ncbi:hypothetical protein [Thermosyntropha sp.]|uniref:hypothetical protein n=1 Tax=Thermosyntropha sp. TaxID=2740820 RepID=UPI0025D6185B|nr:hypothetical protein [Thermosyntropha sp.]MBO8159914.1 hypothetical protein [Thermosyntropha sp.]